jgi:serine protease Do
LLLTICAVGCGAAHAAPGQVSGAEAVYATAPPRLLQIRTLLTSAGQQTSNGSAFLVSADGLAITNYHVVSQVIFEPNTYRLEYTAADGTQGDVHLLGAKARSWLWSWLLQSERRRCNAPRPFST